MRLLANRLFVLLLVGLIPALAFAADKEIEPVKTWSGSSLKEEGIKEAPKSGVITDAEAWAKLWKAWKFEEKLPEVDFKKQIVLVTTAGCAANKWSGPQIKLTEKGDLRPQVAATEIGGPGFIYLIQIVDREGVKTIHGKPLKDK